MSQQNVANPQVCIVPFPPAEKRPRLTQELKQRLTDYQLGVRKELMGNERKIMKTRNDPNGLRYKMPFQYITIYEYDNV